MKNSIEFAPRRFLWDECMLWRLEINVHSQKLHHDYHQRTEKIKSIDKKTLPENLPSSFLLLFISKVMSLYVFPSPWSNENNGVHHFDLWDVRPTVPYTRPISGREFSFLLLSAVACFYRTVVATAAAALSCVIIVDSLAIFWLLCFSSASYSNSKTWEHVTLKIISNESRESNCPQRRRYGEVLSFWLSAGSAVGMVLVCRWLWDFPAGVFPRWCGLILPRY